MRRGFTIVELLVVITVIVTLMTIMFRLNSISGETAARNMTIDRLQRLENCISGYYAAFGSYPPVKVHGSRNIFYPVNKYGLALTEQPPNNRFDYKQIEAALESQPLSADFPYPKQRGTKNNFAYVDSVSDAATERYNNGEDPYCNNELLANHFDALEQVNSLSSKRHEVLWSKCQLFRFGLLSYLLPRYLIMMGHEQSEIYGTFDQWSRNNELPCRFEDGLPFASWEDLNSLLQKKSNGDDGDRQWEVEAIPSQAVTARWMPNLEKILALQEMGELKIFGIVVTEPKATTTRIGTPGRPKPTPKIYPVKTPATEDGTCSQNYALDGVTCNDGWENEFFYYSPAPYQTYRLWSAGPNGQTFPPWITPDEIAANPVLNEHRKEIMQWISDDIVSLSN